MNGPNFTPDADLALLVNTAARLLRDGEDFDTAARRGAELIQACRRQQALAGVPDHLDGLALVRYVTGQPRRDRAIASLRTHLRALVRQAGVKDRLAVEAEAERQLDALFGPSAPTTPAAEVLAMREEFQAWQARRTVHRNAKAAKRLPPQK